MPTIKWQKSKSFEILSFKPLWKVLARVDMILLLLLTQQMGHEFWGFLTSVHIVFQNVLNGPKLYSYHVSSFAERYPSFWGQGPRLCPHLSVVLVDGHSRCSGFSTVITPLFILSLRNSCSSHYLLSKSYV
jgi:hypothetical protein